MSRSKDPEIGRRDTEIVDYWLSGASYEKLATMYRVSVSNVRRIIRAAGRSDKDRVVKRGGLRPMAELRPLSNLHSQIGSDVSLHRVLKLGLSQIEFAKKVGMSLRRLQEVEGGCHDLALTELKQLSELIGTPVEQLVCNRNSGACPGK